MNTLLEALYAKPEADLSSLEKSAESAMLDLLRDEGHVEENPYSKLSDEELAQLYQSEVLGKEGEKTAEQDPELEKLSFDMLGGQIMAHAFNQELEFIKIAVANGICRVCKENAADPEVSTICESCSSLGEEQE